MRVQTEEWRRFIPGVRMYQGKMTLFYNGEKLWDAESEEFLIYTEEDRNTWEVIIILPGVKVIPANTFRWCYEVETVIMSDTVQRIGVYAFVLCKSLQFVKFSRNLEYIGYAAFWGCYPLTSIFIPPSCRDIAREAFRCCDKLIIFSIPQHTTLGTKVICDTALFKASPFEIDGWGDYYGNISDEEVNDWIRNLHADNEFSLHRACRSYNPLHEVIFDIVKRQGFKAFKRPDSIGVTASQYLSENPYTEIEEQQIIKRYIFDMMGEVI